MKLFNKVSILFASLALIMGAGLVGSNDAKEVKAEKQTVKYTVASTTSVTTSGVAPSESKVTFANTYGTKDQMTSGNSQTLTLDGFNGNKITAITLSMHSNTSKGTGTFSATVGSTTIAAISRATAFNKWYDNTSFGTSYRDVKVNLINNEYVVKDGESIKLVIAATINSLYCQSFTLEYESAATPTYKLSIASGKDTIYVGDTGTFKYTFIDPNGDSAIAEDIEWESSDSTKFTINKSSGEWTAIAAGDVTINCIVANSESELFEKSLSISINEIPVLDSLSILNKVTNFLDGDSFTLGSTATIQAKYSDDSVVVIDEKSNQLSYTIDGNPIAIGDKLNVADHNGKLVRVTYNDGKDTVTTIGYTITVSEEIKVGEGIWSLVTDISQLNSGDLIVLANSQNSATAGDISGKYMAPIDSNFSNDNSRISTLNSDTMVMRANLNDDVWTFVNGDGLLLGSTTEKTVTWSKGTTTWNITISDEGNAIIQNTTESYGKILYNGNSGQQRFTTYSKSSPSDSNSMFYPQIYKFVEKTKVELFIEDWQALRAAAGNEGICHYLSSANRAELDAMLERYKAFSDADKAIIDAAKDGDTTIGNTIVYVTNVIAGTQPTDKDYTNSGVIITSNYSIDSTSLIALFALLGISAISAYYFIEKKKLSK